MGLFNTIKVLIYTLSESQKITSIMKINGADRFYDASQNWAKNLLIKAKIDVELNGSNYNKQQSYLIIANHSSYLDIPVLLANLNLRFVIMYKKELEKIPFFGKGIALSPFISVIRTNPRDAVKSLERATELIKDNVSVLVFPEGTRTDDGALGEFKKGATRIAYKSQVDILPVRINGTYDLMPKNSMKMESGKVFLDVKEPILYSEYSNLSENELLNKLQNLLAK